MSYDSNIPGQKKDDQLDKLATTPPIDWDKNELITTADLSYSGNGNGEVYHFIYASQLYGSLFAIYAKFTPNTTNGWQEVINVNLQLLNYAGVVNIGFTDKPYFHPKQQGPIPDADTIYFGIKAGIVNQSIDCPISIPLTKGTPKLLKFCRFLYPMDGFVFDKSKRDQQAMDAELPTQNPPTLMPTNIAFFDTEFQYRTGVGYYNRVLRPGLAPDPKLSVEQLAIKYGDVFLTKRNESLALVAPFITARCTQSNINLVYY